MDDKLVRLSDVTAAMNSEGYTKNMRVHKKVLSIPAVDAVEVVRCRECKRSSGVSPICTCSRGCGIHNPYGNSFVNDTDYCAWGQRREDGDA